MEIQEILPQIYRCGFVLNGRPVYQYLLVGEEHTLLVDTGVATTPQQVILPALKLLGIPQERVRFAVITHCDLDHQGGAHQLKAALPTLLLACGDLDRPLVEDPHVLFQKRYNAYGLLPGRTCSFSLRSRTDPGGSFERSMALYLGTGIARRAFALSLAESIQHSKKEVI